MRVSMKITLDGLLRALRMQAHRLADEIEAGRHDGQIVAGDRTEKPGRGGRDVIGSA